MGKSLSKRRLCALSLLPVLLMTVGAAAQDHWVRFSPGGAAVIEETAPALAHQVRVNDFGLAGFDVAVEIAGLGLEPQKSAAGEFVRVVLPEAQPYGQVGEPALPVVRRLFAAPAKAAVQVELTTGMPAEIDLAASGLAAAVMPRQGPIPKVPGALEAAPFAFDQAAYAREGAYPDQGVVIEELGVVRGERLFMLELRPVAYNPVAQTLTVWRELRADVRFIGGDGSINALSDTGGFDRVVVNPGVLTGAARGTGNYLIICANAFESAMAPFADAKQAQGFTVGTHAVPPGTSSTAIKSHIQSLWGTADSPDYIILVGDTETIPHWIGGGSGSPATDLPYACMDGGGDWYPDIAIGRFPVDNAAEVQAVVDKTLYYENGPLADPAYLKRAAFMASVDQYQVSEGTHNYVIGNYMDPYGYESDKLYQVTYGATTQDVRDSFNSGRFYGIYSGHGSTYGWADGPPFSQSDVLNLTNRNMYAFICSFACVTGEFTVDECFMETWVLAPNKAAVTAWGSSVTSYWDEDDILEKRLFDVIFDNGDDVPTEAGPVYNETKLRYLAFYGPTGTTRRYFEMYNLLGDPALRVPSACSDAGEIQLDRVKYGCAADARIEVADCGLNLDDGVIDSVEVTIRSESEPGGEGVVLTETDAASAQFTGTIELSPSDAAGVLLVSEGDTVTAIYVDDDDGQGGFGVTVIDTAVIDCTPPVISGVEATEVEPRSATVSFETDEPSRGTVRYGTSCAALTGSATGSGYSTSPTVGLTGLFVDTTYYYAVDAEDEAGNTATDDAHGACYSFATPEVPDFFTEMFASDDNDLDNISLVFAPNGSGDFYAICAEPITALPTDPAGGTSLDLWDDDYESVTLSGGASVSIYGTAYTRLYPASNGYVTFSGGDSGYTETFEDHFSQPRIAALFDDLDPSDGGTVSYRQLEDRFAVTWQNVPEYGTTNSNTCQIVMYFDGRIELNYLSVAARDGLAGLSDGGGVDPEFFESDLSASAVCVDPGEVPDCDPPSACACPNADVNCDDMTDGFDIAVIRNIGNWLQTTAGAADPRADVNRDGVIDGFDVASVRSADCWLR